MQQSEIFFSWQVGAHIFVDGVIKRSSLECSINRTRIAIEYCFLFDRLVNWQFVKTTSRQPGSPGHCSLRIGKPSPEEIVGPNQDSGFEASPT